MDSIRALTDRQLAAWKDNDQLVAGQIYLINPGPVPDVEISRVGDVPSPSEDELQSLWQRAADEAEKPGFEVDLSGHRGHLYPLKQDTRLQGFWLVFPVLSGEVNWAALTRESQRFSQELSALRQASHGLPPLTFRQLAEAFPDDEDSSPKETPALHWERSKSRVTVEVEDELSSCLMVDYLPIF
jgi:hypothetical protein